MNASMLPDGTVHIPHGNNTRHLGGYNTCHGRIVTDHPLIRSGNPAGFHPADWDILQSRYDLRRFIDLRSAGEAAEAPAMAHRSDIEYHNWPLFDDSVPGEALDRVGGAQSVCENELLRFYYELGGSPEGVNEFYRHIYSVILHGAQSRAAMARFFDMLLAYPAGCTLFHCKGGKDRTGVLAALYLHALGVDWETCMADYLLTNRFTAAAIQEQIAGLRRHTDDPDALEGCRRIISVDRTYWDRAMTELTAEFGSLDRYFTEALALTPEKRIQLRRQYTRAAA
ncbi:tyrosine-protein phosphatase [Ruminococcaceae bacterium OttesenSCG-928-L11]|nr:tyrosine-protein phosphatase [Ruminococcaceae bacterium OttesenSCG-928-L11]